MDKKIWAARFIAAIALLVVSAIISMGLGQEYAFLVFFVAGLFHRKLQDQVLKRIK